MVKYSVYNKQQIYLKINNIILIYNKNDMARLTVWLHTHTHTHIYIYIYILQQQMVNTYVWYILNYFFMLGYCYVI